MKHYNLKELRDNLKFGDAKAISEECGVSTTTFQKALRGEINTPAAKMIIAITTKLVEQRLERIEYLKKVVKPLYISKHEA
jgi:hypothetical protein